jgi:hypothetical protein
MTTPNRRTFVIVALALVGGLLLLWTIRHLASTGFIEVVAAEYGVPGFRPRCLVSVSTGWCGDPAPGAVKTLTIDYMCGPTRKRASAADYTPLVLSCP